MVFNVQYNLSTNALWYTFCIFDSCWLSIFSQWPFIYFAEMIILKYFFLPKKIKEIFNISSKQPKY